MREERNQIYETTCFDAPVNDPPTQMSSVEDPHDEEVQARDADEGDSSSSSAEPDEQGGTIRTSLGWQLADTRSLFQATAVIAVA